MPNKTVVLFPPAIDRTIPSFNSEFKVSHDSPTTTPTHGPSRIWGWIGTSVSGSDVAVKSHGGDSRNGAGSYGVSVLCERSDHGQVESDR